MSTDKTCFVIMGFGKKTDYQTGRVLDLDASYHSMIKPAVEESGLKCIRADEIVHSGVIDTPMYRQLLTADVVIADLSTYNPNAFYELGVRHALRPFTTITIAEEKLVYPFDVNHVAIRRYKHLGDDIGVAEAKRFTNDLKKAITEILKTPTNDSPVYEFLKDLQPPALREAVEKVASALKAGAVAAASSTPRGGGSGVKTAALKADQARPGKTLSALMQQAEEAQKEGDFSTAKKRLVEAREMMQPRGGEGREDPYFIQRLALVTYKSKKPRPRKALENARDLLVTLNPETSNDTETLGLWGAVHKRLWEETGERPHLDEAIRGYERGFYLRNDYYNGINLAYLLNVRASERANTEEAIADFVQAQRIRRQVVSICENTLKTPRLSADEKYWVSATMAEAYLGIGDEKQHKKWLKKAYSVAAAGWMKESTEEQLGKLRPLLADSPVKRLT